MNQTVYEMMLDAFKPYLFIIIGLLAIIAFCLIIMIAKK